MSAILTNRLKNHIESNIAEILYTDDCKNDSSKIYSRGLAAICLAGLSGNDYKNIVNYITDGTKDNGIDGVFYDKSKNKIYIIQSKWSTKGSGTIGTGDLRNFLSGVYDLLNEEWKKFNSRFKAISSEISTGIRNDPEIILVAAYNSDNPISTECQEIINNFLNENNTESQEVVSFKSFHLKDLVRTVKVVKSGAKSDIEVNLLQWGEQKEPYYAIYGKVSCADIAEWHKSHGDLLFTENIRNTLADSIINNQIETSILTTPETFWYLNNGITAISDGIQKRPIGLGDQKESSFWNVSNIKIVNGAQTTGAIAKAYAKNQSATKRAYAQIKIISLEKAPIDIANQITTATNTQNRVEPKDFLALDPTQESIAESFAKIGIKYCYRRGEKVIDIDTGLDVQELAMVLAVSHSNINNVVVAKRNAGSLTDPNGHYSKVFNSSIDASATWNTVKKWREVTKALSNIEKELTGREAQLAVHGNRFIEHLILEKNKVTNYTNEIKALHKKLNNSIEELYPECYLAVLFKNAKKCEALKLLVNQ